MPEHDADAAAQTEEEVAAQVDVSREAALRRRLVDARRAGRLREDDATPEAKRQRVDDADSARNGGEDSAEEAPTQVEQPQRETPRRPAAPWSSLRRSAHPSINPSRSIYAYERLNHIQEGTYGVVFRARPRDPPPSTTSPTPSVVAVKKLKLARNGLDSYGFPITSLREIQTLSFATPHPHIVRLHEVCVGKTLDQIFLVMEFMEHDLKTLLAHQHRAGAGFAPSEVKTLLHQLLGAVAHLHGNWIVHRDLKSSNLLVNNRGALKVADFGLARRFGDPVAGWTAGDGAAGSKLPPVEPGMTDLVVTLWYRAPEVLLLNHVHRARESWHSSKPLKSALTTSSLFRHHSKPYPNPQPPLPAYDEKIDVWSIGCIFAELLLTPTSGTGLFEGTDEAEQLRRIDTVLGGHNSVNWPNVREWMGLPQQNGRTPPVSAVEVHAEAQRRKVRLGAAFEGVKLTTAALDLLFQLLQYDPKQRISAKDALQHEYFTSEPPRMAHPDSFGSFPSSAAGERVVDTPAAPDARAVRKGKEGQAKQYAMEFDFAA